MIEYRAGLKKDFLLVGSADGSLNALDRSNGDVLWSLDTGGPLFASSEFAIVPGIDGAIYFHSGEVFEIHSMSIQEIVSRSPFSLGDGIMYIGSKSSSLFMIDSQTGIISKCFRQDDDSCSDFERNGEEIIIGRADYSLKAIDIETGDEKWNVTYSAFVSETNNDIFSNLHTSNVTLLSNLEDNRVQLRKSTENHIIWEKILESPVVHFHKSYQEDVHFFFEEHLSIGQSDIKISESGGALFALQPDESFLYNTIYVKPQLLLALGDKIDGHELVPYVSCTSRSAFYPGCLTGIHKLPSTDETKTIEPVRNDLNYNYIALFSTVIVAIIGSVYTISRIKKQTEISIIVPKQTKPPKKKKRKSPKDRVKKEKKVETIKEPEKQIVEVVEQFEELGDKVRIGDLLIHTDEILGYGSSGTIVYKGYFDDRPVAVKRMIIELVDIAQQEMEILLESDEHPSVIRYYTKMQDKQFIYLSLSYCPASLDTYITTQKIPKAEKKSLLSDLSEGLHHLHKLQIVHRDLKPSNILITEQGRAKISDMGLAKKISNEKSSFSTTNMGTYGWQAPEIIMGTSQTKKVDIFSFGCVCFYVLSNGRHPFGETYERQSNIVKDHAIFIDGIRDEVVVDLIEKCIRFESSLRPPIEEIKRHIYFWNDYRRLDFIRDASATLEFADPTGPLVQLYEQQAYSIIGFDWTTCLHPILLADLNRYRKYDGSKLRGFLRVIRNKAQHYRDLHPDLQLALGSLPSGYLKYFTVKFPKFLIYTFNFIKEHCAEEDDLVIYFQ